MKRIAFLVFISLVGPFALFAHNATNTCLPNLPPDSICKNFQVKYDSKTKDTTYTYPAVAGFTYIKVKNGTKSEYYLNLSMTNNMIGEAEKGIAIKMDNGYRIQKPNKEIETKREVSKNKHEHNSFMSLTPTDIKLLNENKIAEHRMYMYRTVVSPSDASRLFDIFQCLLEK